MMAAPILTALEQLRPDPAGRVDIQPARRLFQDQQPGVFRQQADEHALLVAAGELFDGVGWSAL